MYILHLTVTALLLAPNVVRATDQCSQSRATNLKLSVTSRRNQTGHWVVKSDLFSTDPIQQRTTPREVFLDVEHGTVSCEQSETLHITTTVTVPTTPPPDFELFPGLGYYKFHTTALSWEDARDTCVREGAHLLIINSGEEGVVVKEFFARNPKILNGTHMHVIHVGVHDRYDEGQWVTVLGKPLVSTGYAQWHSGEPHGKTGENCVFIPKDVTLFDGPCSWKLSFVCERS